MIVKDLTTVYQHGTLAMLVAGLFEGTMPLSELLTHGDSGIGTADSLDGELVIADGKAYQVRESGEVVEMTPDTKIPFASVHYDDVDAKQTHIENMNDRQLQERLIKDHNMFNVFYAIKITGTFSHMHTRVVPRQEKPYPKLTVATKVQPEFEQDQVHGTIVGYFMPYLFLGAAVGGIHWHFINDARDFGGHILDFQLASGDVSVQVLENLNQHLPVNNTPFRDAQMNLQQVGNEINEAEH